jgi:hypothetical protein
VGGLEIEASFEHGAVFEAWHQSDVTVLLDQREISGLMQMDDAFERLIERHPIGRREISAKWRRM